MLVCLVTAVTVSEVSSKVTGNFVALRKTSDDPCCSQAAFAASHKICIRYLKGEDTNTQVNK